MNSLLCYLLRTILAKSDKDRLRVAHTSFEEIKDVSKVEKHLVQVLDRISKKEKHEKEDEDKGTFFDNKFLNAKTCLTMNGL